MKEQIKKFLEDIEKEKKVKILFAVESGSRAWGMESKNSDYDVRFVYFRPAQEYVSVSEPVKVIQRSFNKEGERVSSEGCFFDIQGFDIIKFVRMLWVSNPTCIEWLRSDIVYFGEQNKVFKEFVEKRFKAISLYYHYKSMCRQNYLKYLKSGNLVTYKKYLYAMRGLVNAKWVAHNKSLPPIRFPEVLEKIREDNFDIIDEHIVDELENIIKLKQKLKEKDIVKNYSRIDAYIESFLKDDSEAPTEKQLSTINVLDEELKRIVFKFDEITGAK